MFSKKKEVKRRPRDPGSLEQFGIFQVPEKLEDLGQSYSMDDDNDDDFEAELAQLTSSDNVPLQPRRKAPPIPAAKLDAMIDESMRDIDPEAELSGDDNDADLLSELKEITGDQVSPLESDNEEEPEATSAVENVSDEATIKLLEERLRTYKLAAAKAKSANESSKSRRFGRGAKTLEGLLASARMGKSIDQAEIPPVLPLSALADKKSNVDEECQLANLDTPPVIESTDQRYPLALITPDESIPVPMSQLPEPVKSPDVDHESLEILKSRQREYKVAALMYKKSGNLAEAMSHVKIAKQFDMVISAVEAGEPIDLADMPESPQLPETSNGEILSPDEAGKEESETQQRDAPSKETENAVTSPPAAITGDAIVGALKERLEIYRRTKIAAEEEGNSSKARRYGRICKQFEDALKSHARGKPVDYDQLPTPPGLPPIMAKPPEPAASSENTTHEAIPESEPQEQETPAVSRKKAPVPPPRTSQASKKTGGAASRAEKQAVFLLQRQMELKQAALAAKTDGDLDLARDYLRQAKGLTRLIEASRCGLPVDMNSIPLSPNAKTQLNERNLVDAKSDDSFTLVSSIECLEEASGTDQQIYENMEKQLIKQAKWCLTTRDHSKALGDVAGYNRWERLAVGYTRDLDMLRVRKRDGLPPPQHHYEVKTYAIVQSCTDLGDGDAEISIIRGVNYPKDVDTYVMIEYPYPPDNPQCERTSTIRDTSNPEYEAVYTFGNAVDRSSRQCQRVFKRHALKCQVWSKGCSMNPILCCTHPRGFFRSDSLVGTVTVKLQPLETQCILHDSFPLMDGRKVLGGKLEVKIRVRNPILTKQIEKITDKWLTIG